MMGTPFAVEYACLTMAYFEKQLESNYTGQKPIFYVRYIDDIFAISNMSQENLDNYITFLQNYHQAFKFTVNCDTQVNMLDTTLTIINNKISSNLYCKDTDTHNYLDYSSCHPPSCKDNIPYSQFLRIKKICSNPKDYKENSSKYTSYFQNKGYPTHLINKMSKKADTITRDILLNPNIKDKEKNAITFPIIFNPINKNISQKILSNFKVLQEDADVKDIFNTRPIVAYKRDRNLKDTLVHSKLKSTNDATGTTPCNATRCLTCKYICSDTLVIGPKSFYEVRQNFNCKSKELIYCLSCKKCGDLYVGETGRALCDRFREHRRNIINKNENNEIALHFNSNGHSLEDIQIQGLKYCSSTIQRKLEEAKIIGKLGCVLGRGMNTDFNFVNLVDFE